jgi:hypothetical protein
MLTLDEDMNAMYLTDKKNKVNRELHDHEDLEDLLESFSKQVEEIVNEAENIEVSDHCSPMLLDADIPRVRVTFSRLKKLSSSYSMPIVMLCSPSILRWVS